MFKLWARIALSTAILGALGACATPGGHELQLSQEEHACAEIGMDPGSMRFDQCVANLEATTTESLNHAYD